MERNDKNRSMYSENEIEASGPGLWEPDLGDRAWMNAISILDSIESTDVTEEAMRAKENIWKQVEARTYKQPKPSDQQSRSKKWIVGSLSIAASLVVGLIAGFSFYQFGYKDGIGNLASSNVEINSPMGVISEIELPDGSRVTLNGGTRLTYPSFFGKDSRQVTLDGEGYFDVAPDEQRPFYVQSMGMNIKVLGTQFTLRAYSTDPSVSVTLKEGKIDAQLNYGHYNQSFSLRPNQQISFNRQTGKLSNHFIDASEETAWKEGKLFFRNVTLENIALQLERKFDVRITIEEESLRQKTYITQFERGESLEQILSVLRSTSSSDWKSEIDGKDVRIYSSRRR